MLDQTMIVVGLLKTIGKRTQFPHQLEIVSVEYNGLSPCSLLFCYFYYL